MKILLPLLIILALFACKKDKDTTPACTFWSITGNLQTINGAQYHAIVLKKVDNINVDKAVTDTTGIRNILTGYTYKFDGKAHISAPFAFGSALFTYKHQSNSTITDVTLNSTCY